MKNLLLALALALFCSGCAYAQEALPAPGAQPSVVPVGKGSYASFPPPDAQKVARPTLEKPLYLLDSARGRPIPTNHWWTNALTDRFAGQLWSFPLQTKTSKDGLEITFPTRWNDSGSDPVSESPLRVGGENFSPADSRVKSWSDWLVTLRLGESPSRYFDVTLGRGLPYVWIESKGVVPTFEVGADAKFFSLAGADVALPFAGEALGLESGGRAFGLFAPTGTQFARAQNTVSIRYAGPKSFLVVCPLPAKTDLATFAKYAFAIPRDSRLTWDYSPNKAMVTTKWHLQTELLQGSEKRLIQGWLPHHYRNTSNDLKFNSLTYLSPRGPMKCAVGTDFSISYPFGGFPPFLPAPSDVGFDATRMHDYIARYATRTEYGGDTYWGGKSLTQLAQYMALARANKDPDESKLRSSLKTALSDWYSYTPGEKEHYFARYPNWKALIGFSPSYGSEAFNDNHFHYGYFSTASAMLGFFDPAWLKDYGPMARLVAKQYANWERDDPDYPFLRCFDVWEGHSWAGGFSGGTGDNQESSSEAMQSWSGLFLLGQAMGDKGMTAAGAMGYAMESRSVQEYWFNQHGGNWSPNYKHPVVGMVWSGGNAYGTYFSGDPAWIWGIQWLPMSPALSYLVEDPAFARKSFGEMWAARKASNDGEIDFDKIGPALSNVLLGQAAQVNPDWAAQQMDDLWAKGSKVAHDNDTPGLTYAFAHANRTLGAINWHYSMSLPLSRAYFNAATGATTWLAFNPTDAPQTAQVFKDGQRVGSLVVPPRALASVRKLAP